MRILVGFAFLVVSTSGVAGCFYHHQQQVVTEPIAAPPYK
jgi:hypothetical protein